MDDVEDQKLLECKAGKCMIEGNIVFPQRPKGLLSLWKTDDPKAFILRWTSRELGQENEEPDEWLVMSGAKVERCDKCYTGNVLSLRQAEDRILFWIQEKDSEEANTYIATFAEFVTEVEGEETMGDESAAPTAHVAMEEPTAPPAAAAAAAGAAAPATHSPVTPSAAAPPLSRERVQQALRTLANQLTGTNQQQQQRPVSIPLNQALSTSLLACLKDDPAAVAELKALLPPEYQSDEGLGKVLSSSQLQQTARRLSEAVFRGGLDTLLAALGLDKNVTDENGQAVTDPTLLLILAIEKKYGRKQSEQQQQQQTPPSES